MWQVSKRIRGTKLDLPPNRLRIPNITEVEIEALQGQGGELVTINNHPFTPVPGEPAVVSTSKRTNVSDHGISLNISDKNGFYSPFAYQA